MCGKRIARRVIIASLALAALSTAHAASINVPADYATIQAAIGAAGNGDTVVVASGTYPESIDFKGKAITLTSANPADPAVVAATIIDGTGSGNVVSFLTGEGPGSVIAGFTIKSRWPDLPMAGQGIYCSSASPTIRDCVITEITNGILCASGGSPAIHHCNVYGISYYCIRCSGSTAITNCILRGSGGGILCDVGGAPVIQNCTVARNSDGIDGYGSPTVKNCIISGNKQYGIWGPPPASFTVQYCDVYGNSWANYYGTGELTGQGGNISLDPLFADGLRSDFHEQSQFGRWTPGGWVTDAVTSPCINAGDPASDFSLEPAPNGGRINMGAYGDTDQASKGGGPPSATPPILANEPTFTQGLTNTIKWSSAPGATEHYVEWATDADFTSVVGNSGWMADASATATGLTDGQTYYYRAKAGNAGGRSTWSNVVWSTQDNTPPTSRIWPLVSSPQVTPYFTISWQAYDGTSGVAYTCLFYRFNGGPYVQFGGNWPGTSTLFTSPNGNGTYDFYTCATDNVGNVEPPPATPDQTVVVAVRPPQPDLWICTPGGPWIGQNIYNTTGAGQTQALTVPPGAVGTYLLMVQNQRSVSDSFRLTGTAGNASITVRYFDAATGGNDITAQMTGSGWFTRPLDAGATCGFRLEVGPTSAAAGNTTPVINITAQSLADRSKRDVARAATTIGAVRRPDGLICNAGDTDFIGGGIYNLDGTDQTKGQSVGAGETAVYQLRVQNAGNAVDQFMVRGPSGGLGWTIRYYNAPSGGTDVTYAATHNGWLTTPLARGAVRDFRVEVTPDSTVAVGASFEALLKVRSFWGPTNLDAVKAVTTRE